MEHFSTDIVDPKLKFEFVENDNDVDGKYILAKVKGVFFCPDSISRNQRFYTKSLWEKALSESEVQQKLRTRTMFGTIGHSTRLDDEALQNGKISHIVTKAYIDEHGQGIGEALILNTPTGQILNTVLRAGSEVYVSSRADGKFKGTKNGVPVVDEDTYQLKGWDFVLSPGFLQANPKIAEEFENTLKGDNQMDVSVITRLSEENASLREKMVLKDVEAKKTIEESVKAVNEENDHIKSQLHEAEASITELKESLTSLTEENTKLSEELKKYESIGDSFEQVEEALTKANEFMSNVFENFGTVDQIEEALNLAIEMKESWDGIGSIEEVKAALEIADSLIQEKKDMEDEKKAQDLADKLDVKVEAVKKMMKRGMSEEDIADILGSAKKEMDKEDKEDKEDKGDKEDSSEKKKKYENAKDENLGAVEENEDVKPRKSRAMRLVEELSR